MSEENQKKTDLHHAMSEFMKTDRMHKCIVDNLVKKLGIHRSQHIMLMYLSHTNGVINQKDIAEQFEISAATVSVTIKKLEQAGYVKKEITSKDSRYNNLYITEKGLDIVKKSEKLFCLINTMVFSNFSDEELATLMDYLSRIQESLRKAESEITID